MKQDKMIKINNWAQRVKKESLEITDQMVIANASVEFFEKLEPIYDKYNEDNTKDKRYR